jgi:copper(I)-binding protein
MHVMVMGLTRDLKVGDTVKLTVSLKDGRTQVALAKAVGM